MTALEEESVTAPVVFRFLHAPVEIFYSFLFSRLQIYQLAFALLAADKVAF
ncbi:MAG: hypothetical protein MZV70_55795 [Desulfobacterales bacterium]|nr:hypothetical protein [Desulfobacterales bacterium]